LPKDKKERGEVSRRDFLVGAGAIVVGTAGVGMLAGCGGGTETVTTTKVSTVPTTVTNTTTVGADTVTVTTTEQGGTGGTVTQTVTSTTTAGGGTPIWQEAETTFLKKHTSDGRTVGCLDVKNGKIVRIRPLHWDWKYTEAELNPIKGARAITAKNGKTFDMPPKSLLSHYYSTYKKRVYSPNRILYPLKRVDWEPGGDPAKINAQNRGRSKFKRISWDELTTTIAN